MKFNNGSERVRLENRWKKLRIQYREAGMSEDAIQAMYQFDLDVLNSERAYVDNTQPVFATADDEDSVDFKRYEKAITVTDVYHETKTRFAWVGEIKSEKLHIQKLKPIIRSRAAYAPPEVVDGKPPIYPYTPIKSSFEDAGSVEEMMMYTELQSAVHAMIQRLEYSFTFNPTLLTIPKRKQQVAEILEEAEKYIWRIKEEMRCA